MNRGQVAIVGVGCRLRGVRSGIDLLRRLGEPAPRFDRLPPDRWDGESFGTAPRARLLEEYDVDFRAFRIPPAHVASMHRIERALLAAMHAALVDSGRSRPGSWGERTTVHVGASTLGSDPIIDHQARVRLGETGAAVRSALEGLVPEGALAAALAALERSAPPITVDSLMTTAAMAAGRLTNAFDLGGGHLAYDAGSASSLAALAAAVAALGSGECDLAVVGAVSPLLATTVLQAHARRGLLGDTDTLSDGVVHPEIPGTLLAEGAVALVLQRDEDARGSAARVYAVVRGVGTAVAGARPAGTTERAVSSAAARALADAGFDGAGVDYVECLGARLRGVDGDELRGVLAGYGAAQRERPLPVASCVPTFGFLGAASGLASVVAGAMAIERGERPSPIERDLLVDTVRARSGHVTPVRRVGVSSTGLGGVAYHAVLAHADETPPRARVALRTERDRRLAIVGMGVVLPGGADLASFWERVSQGQEAIQHFPRSRWDAALYQRAGEPQAEPPLAGVLDPLRPQAAQLRIPPVALAQLDGAVILAMQACIAALADAGHRPGLWDPDRVGVVVGHLPLRAAEFEAERSALAARSIAVAARALRDEGLAREVYGAAHAALERHLREGVRPITEDTIEALSSLSCASRLASLYDFRGSAVTVDAACASSLAALQLAARALAAGELDVAVVGASAFNLVPEYFAALGTLGALTPTGRHRAFEAGADGFIPGEGAGALVVKRAVDALRDGDRIYALVPGIGWSSDGRGPYLATNSAGEQRALQRAYSAAGVRPSTVDLIEGHGAGTKVGDAVEIEACSAVFAERDRSHPVVIGSVKSIIGHLSSAAGMAGLAKAALALHHRELPPMRSEGVAHADHPALAGSPFVQLRERRAWAPPPDGAPRRAGVNAFGIGGVNYHAVLEEAIAPGAEPTLADGSIDGELDLDRSRRLAIELQPLERPAGRRRVAPEPRSNVLLVGWDGGAEAEPGKGPGTPGQQRRAAIGAALRALLQEQRVEVLAWDPPADLGIEAAEAQLRALDERAGAIAGIIELSAIEHEAGASDAATMIVRRGAAIIRVLEPRLAASDRAPRPFFLALTGMGGDLGFAGAASAGVAAAGGAAAGFVKGLKQEYPSLLARAIDFDPAEDVAFIAETALAELGVGGDRTEVGYRERRRVVPTLHLAGVAASSSAGAGGEPLVGPGHVVLFSGGGRGVVLECARALSGGGTIAVVTGRTQLPAGDEPWLALSDEEFAAYERSELLARRRRDPSLTPVRFARIFEPLARARALHRNLAAARAAREPVEYLAADVTDAQAAAALVAEVRRRFGRLDGVVHGAMVEKSRSLADKEPEVVEATVRTKVAGLENLLAALGDSAPRFVVAFGSIAGRFGNRGQVDYCAANEAMARTLAAYGRRNPAVRCVTIDWTAWARIGAAADPRTAELLAAAGVVAIEPAEGARRFLDELGRDATASPREVVVCHEEQALLWPGAARPAESEGALPAAIDDDGRPLVEADWPMIDEARAFEGAGRSQTLRTFSTATDPMLGEHRLYETPVLPGAFALEALAEAAVLCHPGEELLEMRDFHIEAPLRLPRGSSPRLRTEASARGLRNERVMEVRSLIDLPLGPPGPRTRLLFRGTVLLRPRTSALVDGLVPLPPRPPGARDRSVMEQLKAPIALGPRFLSIGWVERGERSVRGVVESIDERALFTRTTCPRFFTDPMLLDAAFQLASNWDACRPGGWLSIPLGLERVMFHARRPPGAGAYIEAEVNDESSEGVRYHVTVRAGGALLVEIINLRMRRIERTPDERGKLP